MKFFFIIAVFLFCFSLQAIELINLNIDFEGSNWEELMSHTQNAFLVEDSDGNHALRLPPYSNLATPRLPYHGGDLHVDFKTAHTRIDMAENTAWKVGLVWIVYYAGEQELGHRDLYYAREEANWHDVKCDIVESKINKAATHFKVVFNQFGNSGTLDIDDILIRIELPGKNLCGDQSFNGTPGLDHWFPLRAAEQDWDLIPLGSVNGKADYVSGVFPGRNSAHLTGGPATLRSARYPYNGEELIIGAWYRQKNIVKGSQGWCNAGIQIALYDENGNMTGHKDLLPLLPGDSPWTYYQIRIPSGNLGRAVKSFQIYIRIFDGGSGEVWVSELCVLPRAKGEFIPYDPEKAQVAIDAAHPAATKIVPVWDGIDLSYSSQAWEPSIATHALPGLKAAGFRHLRLREFMNALDYISGWENGKPITNFSKIDKLLDIVVRDNGFIPTITIESTPPSIAIKPDKNHFCNHYPPKDFGLWEEAVYALMAHWIERYGKEVLSQWHFECWNEPSSTGFFKGTLDDFKQLVVHMLNAADRIEHHYGVHLKCTGASDVSISPWYRPTWDNLKSMNRLERLDFISMHLYGGYVSSFYSFGYHIREINKWRSEYPELKDKPLYITEYNGDTMNTPRNDEPVAGAFAIKAVRFYMDNDVHQSFYFSVADFLYGQYNLHFKGGLGIFTRTGIAKPVLQGFRLLNKLRDGYRLPMFSSNDPADGLAIVQQDGTICILLTTFDEARLTSNAPIQLALSVTLPPGFIPTQKISTMFFDNEHGNSLKEYQKLGSPVPAGKDDPVPFQINKNLKLGEGIITDFTVEQNVLKTTIFMPLNSGMLLTVSPAPN